MESNAGHRLIAAQNAQATNLCIGLDAHYEPQGLANEEFYLRYATDKDLRQGFVDLFWNYERAWPRMMKVRDPKRAAPFLAGVTNYYCKVIDAAWAAGIRVFKPQSSFYEFFMQPGMVIMYLLLEHIRKLTAETNSVAFVVDDAKRGDIDTTQARYFWAYLSARDQEVYPGVDGQFDFDTMTVKTWMGDDVLTPAVPFLKAGKGVIVVTRSSNPSGTSLQDLLVTANESVELSDKQKPFRVLSLELEVMREQLGRDPMAHEVMLNRTEVFCEIHGLITSDVSPVFSVLGATTKMDASFRKLRPSGTALVPGFGKQKGGFGNVMSLVATEGDLAGHGVMWSSSRNHNFPWQKDFGGDDDPNPANLPGHMVRVIDTFRASEKEAYTTAGLQYPF